jgi:hypothetical protein
VPNIAAAHPHNAGLRLFAKMRPYGEAEKDFDHVLDFIAAKNLCPESLEARALDELAAGAKPA